MRLPTRAPGAASSGTADESIDPTTGGVNVADAASRPAVGWRAITLADTNLTWRPRALRFDVGGAVKLSVLDPDGETTNTFTRNFTSGDVISAACVLRVWLTGTDAGVVVDGWS